MKKYSRKLKRVLLKKFYKAKRKDDQQVGLEINRLFFEFFEEKKFIEQSGKPPDKETALRLGQLASQIKALREPNRFRDDFPTFSSFMKYIDKEKISLKNLRELV